VRVMPNMQINPTIQFLIVALAIAGVVIIVLRSWRTILKWVLAVAALVIAIVIGVPLLWENVVAPQVDPQTAETVSDVADLLSLLRPQPAPAPTQVQVTTRAPFAVSMLLFLLLLALGAAGYFWIRWHLATRRHAAGGEVPTAGKRRRKRRELEAPVVYVLSQSYDDDEEEGFDLGALAGIDLSHWGF
jgi:hypothetical protein